MLKDREVSLSSSMTKGVSKRKDLKSPTVIVMMRWDIALISSSE
jgi:hypothetical protein